MNDSWDKNLIGFNMDSNILENIQKADGEKFLLSG